MALFRYKSIVCEEDPYFRELLRYIHMNPPHAGAVESLSELDRYPWSGHAVIVCKLANDWQDRYCVLRLIPIPRLGDRLLL